uniref:DPBB_1 domain-containing protein n=1 Tax=Steinernema glaseri TaxID=37863 RepID=A0A1I7YAU4_9BILA
MHLLLALLLTFSPSILAVDIPFGVDQNGDFTYYTDSGYGACGSWIDASTEDLVAVSHEWFSTAEFPNPNNDPVCKNVCVRVSYKGNSISVPVMDKCPSCRQSHLDLSQTAFQQLADLDEGHVYGAVWSFERC